MSQLEICDFSGENLKVLKCYNILWVQRRHNCSPAASFANCVTTLYLLKVHLQTFLSISTTQKFQILSCDTLVANERHVPHYRSLSFPFQWSVYLKKHTFQNRKRNIKAGSKLKYQQRCVKCVMCNEQQSHESWVKTENHKMEIRQIVRSVWWTTITWRLSQDRGS